MLGNKLCGASLLIWGAVATTSASSLTDQIFKNGFELPITAALNTWTWEPFPDAICGDGSTTGIGVNLSNTSPRVLIYLEGGGACWSETTCYSLMTAANFTDGYGQSKFTAQIPYYAQAGSFFDRTAATNPFKDFNYVFVPYCTGDFHAGYNVATYGTHTGFHVGFANMTAYLNRLTATFPAADRIYLAGSSAGGFGATFNWWHVQRAFGCVRVDMIDDSGVFMPPDILAGSSNVEGLERTQWNLAATLPSGCMACATRFDAILSYYASVLPNNRGALLAYRPDSVLPNYYGITSTQFSNGLDELEVAQFQPNPSLQYYVATGPNHVLWQQPTLATSGVSVQQFIAQMVTDSPSWISVHP